MGIHSQNTHALTLTWYQIIFLFYTYLFILRFAYFYFMCWVSSLCVCLPHRCGASGGQKRHQAIVHHHVGVGTWTQSSEKAMSVLNLATFTPAPQVFILIGK